MFRFAICILLSGICRHILPSETGIMSKNASFLRVQQIKSLRKLQIIIRYTNSGGTYNGDTNNGCTNNDITNNDSANIGGFNSVSTNSNRVDRDDKKINRLKSCTFNIRIFSLTVAQRKGNLCNSAERLRHAFIVNCIRTNCLKIK